MSRILYGNVLRDAKNSTAVVVVTRQKRHPLYGKQYKVDKKYLVHDPKNQLKAGEKVAITETKPISKRKRYVIADKNLAEKQS